MVERWSASGSVSLSSTLSAPPSSPSSCCSSASGSPITCLPGNGLRLDRVELGLGDGPAVEQPLGLLDLPGRTAPHRLDVVVELRLGGLGLRHVALADLP